MAARDSDYYENPAHWTAERYTAGFEQQRLQTCVDLVPADVTSLLDIGCGNGAFLRRLEEHGPPRRLVGVDRASAAVAAALCEATLITGSADALPFPSRTIHMVCALDVVEHLPCGVYEAALSEIARVAEHNILINVPYRERRLTLRCPHCGCGFNPHYHMRSFDEATLATLFAAFEPVRMVKTKRRENLLFLATRPFRRRVFGGFPATAICPQCSYRAPAIDPGVPDRRTGLRETVKALAEKLPTLPVAAEIAVLYRRRKSLGAQPDPARA